MAESRHNRLLQSTELKLELVASSLSIKNILGAATSECQRAKSMRTKWWRSGRAPIQCTGLKNEMLVNHDTCCCLAACMVATGIMQTSKALTIYYSKTIRQAATCGQMLAHAVAMVFGSECAKSQDYAQHGKNFETRQVQFLETTRTVRYHRGLGNRHQKSESRSKSDGGNNEFRTE